MPHLKIVKWLIILHVFDQEGQ